MTERTRHITRATHIASVVLALVLGACGSCPARKQARKPTRVTRG